MNKDEFIIKAVKKFLLISDPKELRKKLKPLVKKQGFQSEEDIFNAKNRERFAWRYQQIGNGSQAHCKHIRGI